MAVDLQDLSRRLFAAADQLWTNSSLRPDQYAQPVLALIALRQMEAKFQAVHQELAPKFTGRLKPKPSDYQARGAVYLPEEARFSKLLALPGTADLGAALNAAMKGIADTNPDLAGALPQGYGALPNETLSELLRLLAPLKIEGDAYGLIFEYFMGQFASSYMQKGGEFFTPASIVKLIVEVIEPYHGTILDPACGSGGMFVHSAEFVRRHHKAPSREISIHGVEKMSDNVRLCRLSERRDIIVITDEAHRSQYDQLAANMRRALPNAAFIGFTGTPLIVGQEQRTKEVFGDYVSIYNFAQSVADGATVPLYYEARKPELQLDTEALKDELDDLLDAAMLDDEQEKTLQREFARQYHLITREDRLDQIAADLVRHFASRGYLGKAMFVAIDKATAVRMYDKVKARWADLIREEADRLVAVRPEARDALADRLAWMREVDFAVVVSQGQNEIAELRAKGLDIQPHRERMQKEDLEARFKNPNDPLRLVFVCAMWITGFDVPTCSTVYLDKPMKNHTLMQTIARANRRAPGKAAGVVVDYVGVFQNLQKALAIYAANRGGDTPIRKKDGLVEELEEALSAARTFCRDVGVDLDGIAATEKLARLKRISDAVEILIAPDERRRAFLRRASAAARAYKALLPDDRATPYLKPVATLHVLAEAIRGKLGPVDISALAAKIEALLDARIEGVAITAPIIPGDDRAGRVDLSEIDFDKLAALFQTKPRTAAEQLRTAAERQARDLAGRNPTRVHLVEKLEKLVEAYNLGSLDAEAFFAALKKLVAEMDDEERRASREGLTEEELAIFDLLTRPEPKLTKAQELAVKKVARELLEKLEALRVEHWRQSQQLRASVHSEIRFKLNELPDEPYPQELWDEKVEAVWQFVYHQSAVLSDLKVR